jgi:hypothetical protein
MDEAFDDVAILAWGVKAALADIRARGAEILKQRIEQRTGRSLHNRTESVLDAWATTLGRAADLWFPDLQAEVDAFRAGQDVAPREYDGYSFAVDTRDAWTIDTRAFMVYYGVQEHQDVLARSLFESAAGNSNIEALMPALSADRAVGTCLQCHQGAVKNNRMYWREAAVGAGLATTAPNGVASFFDHGPHLSVTECSTCHETSSDRTHPFMPTATATCGTCHGTELTSTMTCASCHQYHNEKPTTIVELDSVGSLAILPAHRAVR